MRFFLAALLALTLTGPCRGQSLSNHYVLGVEGLEDAYVPPPGLYLRNYSYYYSSNQLNDATSHSSNLNYHLSVVANASRFTFVTPYQVLGANYGFGTVLPFVYQETSISTPYFNINQSHFGLGDVYFEPIILSWHLEQFDVCTTSGFYAPTGHYNPADMSSPGSGFWTGMYTLGTTWYPDKEKLWNFSILNRLEFSTAQEQTHIQPGYGESFEWGVGRSFLIGLQPKGPPEGILDVGVAGYCNWQFTRTTGPAGPFGPIYYHDQDLAAVGPEILYTMPQAHTLISLRYEPEFAAKARPQRATLNLTITTKLW